jgi:protocatechuate 3,4-dioxygenase beta subunit
MTDDDATIGELLTRRQALAIVAVGGTGLLAGPRGASAAESGRIRLPACVVRPAQTEGPYFLDATLERSDIRSEPSDGQVMPGREFTLDFVVSRVRPGGCDPLPDAVVDVWQCDAVGVYSGVRDIAGQFDTTGKRFLRGHQRTRQDGTARFTTIYPGWYPGRAVHIHFKIRLAPAAERGHEFTSQLYFDETMSDEVFAKAPYSARTGRRTRNTEDGIYRSGGSQLKLSVARTGERYQATFDVGLQVG